MVVVYREGMSIRYGNEAETKGLVSGCMHLMGTNLGR